MARSTRETILTATAELMRRKGYGAVGMKDIVAAGGVPIGSLYHHFPGGKVQIAREALIMSGIAYGMLIPTLMDPYDDLGEAIEAAFTEAASLWSTNMAIGRRTARLTWNICSSTSRLGFSRSIRMTSGSSAKICAKRLCISLICTTPVNPASRNPSSRIAARIGLSSTMTILGDDSALIVHS
jgi:Bacterial regulatory proteins, tetR family